MARAAGLKLPDAKPREVPGRRLAVLVDAENVSPAFAPHILSEAMKRGTVEIRRAFSAAAHSGWDAALVRHAFDAVGRTRHAGGRNAADIELAIAAMDLLHDDRIDGFVIASSDSDFAPLAIRLRQSGRYVLGIGERKTPGQFIKACDDFAYLEPPSVPAEPPAPQADRSGAGFIDLLAKAVATLESEDGWIDISVIGVGLRKVRPDFKPSNYGHKKLKALLQSCGPEVETRTTSCTVLIRLDRRQPR